MATSTEPPIFQHIPLDDAKTHIRLLKVVGVDDTRLIRVHCELTTFLIAEAPSYRAISYTWGDPTSLTSILVNGQPMDVRWNCEYALRQASQHYDDKVGDNFIWIDSICVNQHDNDEKGSQVAMMGDIFKTASQVLACVGVHGDDSEFLYEFLRGKQRRIQKFIQSDAPSYLDGALMDDSKCFRMEEFAWRWRHSRSFLLRLCEAIAKFVARPYFHRVWIYQELFLGRDISVHCGDERVPLSWLWVTNSIVASWLFHTTSYGLFMKLDSIVTVRPMIYEAMPLLLAGAKEQSQRSFREATEHVSTLSCENPRDRVYGILSIITPVHGHHFQPDYTKDTMDLAVEVLQRATAEIINYDHDFSRLAIFAHTVGLNLRLNDKPSQKSTWAMERRRSGTPLQDVELNVLAQRLEAKGTNYWPFLGLEILCQHDKWIFSNHQKWSRSYGPTSQPPKMTKCLQGDSVTDTPGHIHLPPEAKNGDWLLIPRSFYWLSRTYIRGRVAFLARRYDPEKFEIISKVLISKWVPRWGKAFEKCASEFNFHCDHEDLLALFEFCQWESLWWIRTPVDSESSDAYFQTRFCGQRFSSYAVRTETEVAAAVPSSVTR